VTWNLNSVSVSSTGQPTWKFNFVANGKPVVFNTFGSKTELMDGFVGGPNLYLAYAVPQDGIKTPNDYNSSVSINLRKLWRGAAAAGSSLTFDAATGLYTATLAGVTVPASATMITGGIGYFYGVVTQAAIVAGTASTDSLPLTQINVPGYAYGLNTYQGGLSVVAPNVWKQAANQTARRAIVTNAKCNACHKSLGVFTESVFHAGQRNDAPTCTFCHTVNGVNSGWTYNIKEAVHSLHGASKRTVPYSWESAFAYWNVTYPSMLNNCEACHVAGSYNLSNSASVAALPNMLWSTIASGTMPANGQVLTAANTTLAAGNVAVSPFVVNGVNYGLGFSVNTTTANKNVTWGGAAVVQAPGTTLEAEPTTLVNSPITSACYACHDTNTARLHMLANGGMLNVARSTVSTAVAGVNTKPIANTEQCLICHGAGKVADIKSVHMTF
jgi:OmcA/MtrC family decaheme c-type cytochrome